MEWHTALLVGKVSKSNPKHLPYASWSCASTHNLILYNIHTSVSRSTFGTLARSQFCWHKFGQFWIRLKHNYIREMSHPSHPFPTAVAAALGSGALSRLSWDPQALLQETPKCCWWHTHNSSHGIQASQLRWAVLPAGKRKHQNLKSPPKSRSRKCNAGWSPKSLGLFICYCAC